MSESAADLVSQGGDLTPLWLNGPNWLANQSKWPLNLVTGPTVTSEVEAKVIREVIAVTQNQPCLDKLESLLEKRSLQEAL